MEGDPAYGSCERERNGVSVSVVIASLGLKLSAVAAGECSEAIRQRRGGEGGYEERTIVFFESIDEYAHLEVPELD